jgi:hypothetical protein
MGANSKNDCTFILGKYAKHLGSRQDFLTDFESVSGDSTGCRRGWPIGESGLENVDKVGSVETVFVVNRRGNGSLSFVDGGCAY